MTDGFYKNAREDKTEEVGYIPRDESRISDGSKLYECPLDAINSRCLTETCHSGNKWGISENYMGSIRKIPKSHNTLSK